jgi:hypothetical protein
MDGGGIQQQLLGLIDGGDLLGIQALLNRGAQVDFRCKDPDGETPLIRAVRAGRLSVVEMLINAKADINAPTLLAGITPLMLAREQPMIMRALIAAGADVNARTLPSDLISPLTGRRIRQGSQTALHHAAAANNAEAVRILLEAGADLEARDEQGLAPIDLALRLGSSTDASVALFEAGASLTPARQEAIHSGAYSSDSNLNFFPDPDELGLTQGKPLQAEDRGNQANTPSSLPLAAKKDDDLKCPACGELIYSRKARICGKCGTKLSPELRPTDNQKKLLEEERAWARNLADKFGGASSRASAAGSGATRGELQIPTPEELEARAYVEKRFRGTKRRLFLALLASYTTILAMMYWFCVKLGISPFVLTPALISFAFHCFKTWQKRQ